MDAVDERLDTSSSQNPADKTPNVSASNGGGGRNIKQQFAQILGKVTPAGKEEPEIQTPVSRNTTPNDDHLGTKYSSKSNIINNTNSVNAATTGIVRGAKSQLNKY